ncbi:MAG: sigma-70 family RNA polymerase sigma factor [Clostridia bacterium]|nr:sigma-70 family RNA polymerase sigma factor [Clostridia bacterium]
MSRKIVSLGQYEDNLFSLDRFYENDLKMNNEQRLNAENAVIMAIDEELTNKQREVLLLYYFEGKSTIEIAKMLGVNKSSVSRLLSRAKKRIEKVLKYNFR